MRIFFYTPVKEWGAQAWDWPTFEEIRSFCGFIARYGFFGEFVFLTDDDPAQLATARRYMDEFKEDRPANMIWELANEPTSHKNIDTPSLRAFIGSPVGLLFSSGDYEDSSRFFGTYLTAHTGRDSEWPRRAHDLLEYYNGGGPTQPSDPAHRVPVVADEPIRPDQASGDRERDFLAYFGTCSILGAGATYHYEGGKLANRPAEEEQWYADIALQALNAFPADAPKGPYRRIDEGANSLRTYVVGDFSVRVRPKTDSHPEAGWRPIDHSWVLWER